MENQEAIKIILVAAERLARHCEKGDTICFDNEYDEAEGKEIREAVAHLTPRALDLALTCQACTEKPATVHHCNDCYFGNEPSRKRKQLSRINKV